MQLVAYGAMDVYLSGDSYRVVYRRHTNFSYESTEKCFEEFLVTTRFSHFWVSARDVF